MAEGRSCHHRESHYASGADHPGVETGTRYNETYRAQGCKQEAQRHKRIAHVQYKNETVAHSSIASPTGQPQGLKDTRGKEPSRCFSVERRDDPQRQRGTTKPDHDHIESTERNRQAAGVLARKPIAREARYEATTDDHDQQKDSGDTNPNAVVSRAAQMRLCVKTGIAKA